MFVLIVNSPGGCLPLSYKTLLLLMDEILHHLGAPNYCNSQDFRDSRWCKISSMNSMTQAEISSEGDEVY